MNLEDYLGKIDSVAPKTTDQAAIVQTTGFSLTIEPGIWNPNKGKSSPMFIKTLEEYPLNGITSALDLGAGSGILALILSRRGVQRVSAADKFPDSVRVANENFNGNNINIVAIESDLFSRVEGEFDLVVFNSPATHPLRRKMAEVMPTLWSPEENIIQRFLREWRNHKAPNGHALIMYSKFPDFDPLAGDTLNGLHSRVINKQAGEMSESGVIEVWE